MDNGIYNSMVGGSPTPQQAVSLRIPDDRRADGDEKHFQSLLEQETLKSEKADKKENSLIDDKAKAGADKKADAVKDQMQKEIQQEIQKHLLKMSPLLNYLYNLMYKNPDALSLVEKHAVGLDKEILSRFDVEFKEFNRMLSERGMKLSDLTFDQMAKLAQRATKSQVSAYLDSISQEVKERAQSGEVKKTLAEVGKEKMAERASSDTNTVTLRQAEADLKFLHTEKMQAQEQARQERNREVMDQLISHLNIRTLNDKTELVMKLNPEFLGDLKLKLSYDEDKLNVQFETTSKEVREIIEESQEELSKLFAGKGLKLAGTKVTLVDEI